jgi:hypothetical protein
VQTRFASGKFLLFAVSGQFKFPVMPISFDWQQHLFLTRRCEASYPSREFRSRGLPHWAKDEKIAYSTFNARSEQFTAKPASKDT